MPGEDQSAAGCFKAFYEERRKVSGFQQHQLMNLCFIITVQSPDPAGNIGERTRPFQRFPLPPLEATRRKQWESGATLVSAEKVVFQQKRKSTESRGNRKLSLILND